MTGNHDRTGIAAERLADVARQLDTAEPLGDIAVGQGLARRNGAGDVVDAAVELRHAVEIERDIPEIIAFARKQLDDAIDGALHLVGRRRLADVATALPDTGTGLLVAAHRQLQSIDAARTPLDAANTDRGVEQGKMLVSHGTLRIPSFSRYGI